jgi:hypothetical protein
MYLTVPFALERDDGEAVTYVEQVESGKLPVLDRISLRASVLSTPPPRVVRIIVSYHEELSAPSATGGSAVLGVPAVEKPLVVGDPVTIVKSRLRTLASPPEWLGEYLGRTGTVLWTTSAGAMVDFADARAWFPYLELERGGPKELS